MARKTKPKPQSATDAETLADAVELWLEGECFVCGETLEGEQFNVKLGTVYADAEQGQAAKIHAGCVGQYSRARIDN